jgi:hypothetical protein
MSNEESVLYWIVQKRERELERQNPRPVENKHLSKRETMNYFELLEQAKIDRAWRAANPDHDRCKACGENDYRTVTEPNAVRPAGQDRSTWTYKQWRDAPIHILINDLFHSARERYICNRCHPEPGLICVDPRRSLINEWLDTQEDH